jgi:hypothetical protein
MGYTLTQINAILSKADRAIHILGSVAYNKKFAELDETYWYDRDIIFLYKYAVEWGKVNDRVGTARMDSVVERLEAMMEIYDYGSLTPIYSQVAQVTGINTVNFLTEETDPTVPAWVKLITESDIDNWDDSYGNKITSAAVTGTNTKTLTLNQQDGGTVTASWTDINTDAVSSVFGRTGAVIAQSGDYTTTQVTEGLNLYYTDGRVRNAISESIVGIDYNSTTGVFSTTAGYSIPTTSSQSNWDIAYANRITSLTTTGSSGAATLIANILNIPTYTLSGLGGVPTSRQLTINGTSYDLSADRSWSVGTHTGNLNTGFVPKATGATTLTDSLIYDNGSAIGINTTAPFESSVFKLDVNGGVIIKNTNGTTAQLILINSNPATGGNNGFVQLSAGGNTATAFGQWQTYYGTSIASGALRLQPLGGQVLIGTSTTSAFTTDINGTLRVSGQLTLGSTITNGIYTYTLPSATGTLALVGGVGVGTVTSVAASITGNAIGITGSPITSSGTLALAFAGNATQYVRGDGALATLPTNGGGGGASVSYYLNGSINQGTIGGVTYYEMNRTPIIGAGTDFSRNTNGYIASFLTDANDPALLNIPAGNFNFETYFEASSGGGSPTFYIELYKYDGTTFTLIASNSTNPKLINDGTNIEAYFSALAVPQTTLTLTDRLAVRIYVTTAGRTITLHTENGHLCQVITTFTTGLTALNGLTSQVQYLATGTSGTDFNIASATATHTFNLPTASATNRGALSSGDWSVFNAKQNAITLTTTGTSGAATLVGATLNIPQYADQFVGTVTSVAALTLGTSGTDLSSTVANSTTTPVITLNVPTASATNRGALSSADWTTFNNKQAALSGTGFVKISGTTISYDNSTYYLASNPNAYIPLTALSAGAGISYNNTTGVIASTITQYTDANARAAISETVTGLDYNNTTGVLSLTSGYVIPTTTNETNWNAAYNDKINSASVTGTTTKTLTLTQQDGGTITASWTDINTDAVTSVLGRTGAVVAASGDYNTSQVTENTNLYFTNARAIASTLTGYTSAAGTITSSDSILSAIQKLNGNIGALTTGVSSVNGLTGAVTLTTSNIAEGTNLYYTEARVNANTNVAANTAARHNAVTIGTANGLSLSTQVLSLGLASTSTTGALSSTDWNTFNNKTSNTGTVTSVGLSSATSGVTIGSTPITTSGTITLAIATASGSQQGLLSSTDWTTFNGKQAALNGTGFVKISGTTISYDNSTYLTTSAASSTYLPLAGGTLTGALGGTSASFSSSVTSVGLLLNTGGYLGSRSLRAASDLLILYGGTAGFNFTDHTNSTVLASISNSGAATFSSSVTASGTIFASGGRVTIQGTNQNAVWFNQNAGGTSTGYLVGRSYTTTDSQDFFIYDVLAAAPRLFINSSGNVGIGTTSPSNLLHVAGVGRMDTGLYFNNSGTGGAFVWNIANESLRFGTNDTERMRITSGGNVGIGTTSPSIKLDVVGGNGDGIQYRTSTRAIGIGQLSSEPSIFWGSGTPLTFVSGSELMRITSGGSVLIGTTTEGFLGKLQVAGSVAITGQYNTVLPSSSFSYFDGSGQVVSSASSASALYLDTTWNTTGNPDGIYLNVTNTASGASSKLLNLKVGSVSQFSVSKGGAIQTSDPTNGTARPWKLGNAVSGSVSTNYYIIVEVNGQTYSIPALQGLP